MMEDKIFGTAGNRVVIEEMLQGPEASLMAICDGKNLIPLTPAQDHKRINDNDEGPNTGGMGCYSPVPVVTPEIYDIALEQILRPTLDAMAKEGTPYTGVLYAGIMLTEEGSKVIEFNCRFGDPETQVVLPRLKSYLVEMLLAAVDGRLDEIAVDWYDNAAVCVVMASGGYPGSYPTGIEITGLDEAAALEDVVVFHAGTKRVDSSVVTAGGRVLGVTGMGKDFQQAIQRAYAAVEKIHFEGAHYRKDIGRRAIA
jgi:phosphoribosylamine--glycine ligase